MHIVHRANGSNKTQGLHNFNSMRYEVITVVEYHDYSPLKSNAVYIGILVQKFRTNLSPPSS